MKLKSSNAALAILLGGASIVTPAAAQDAAKPTPGAALQYVGADTRLGVGYDSQTKLRGELFQVLYSDDKSASLAEIWASRDSGGAKLSQHWSGNGSAVNKVFGAVDQGAHNMRKASLGGGQEYEQWFWNSYLSKGLSGAQQTGTAAIANTIVQSGNDAGRPYVEDVTTTVTTRSFQRPYDWGVGARAGQFYESALLRVTAGLDYEWGKFSSKQWTGTLVAEKFFAGSPISVAITGEINRRSGDFEGTRSDQRGFVMLRYELGGPKSSFRANKVTRSVTTTERVPDPNWRPAVATAATPAPAPAATTAIAAKPVEPSTRIEKRVIRANSNDAQETYFDLGSAKLKPAALKELDALVGRINAQQPYVDLKVNVVGHTCPTGADRNNVLLSNHRADAVKAYLVAKGVPTETVITSGKAGRSPKYPEVKGQSFRNRRADTEILITKEKTEDVRVVVPGSTVAAAAAPITPAAPAVVAVVVAPATAPMIERQVTRDIVENVPNSWISRALHNPAQHKTSVDSYRWLEASSAQATGPRRFINRAPAAANDAYTVDCTAPVTFNVLANDSDPDGDALTITSVSTPSKGTVAISGGRIVYTPSATSCGGATDSFTYSISDGKGGTATASVAVTINNTTPPTPVNTPPVAVNDAYAVNCSTPRAFNVLLNDSDKDGDKLIITSVSMPGKGTAIISNGNIVYTAAANTCGGAMDNFTYSISDGKGGTATAMVAVTINNTTPLTPVNTAPVAVNDAYAIDCKAASTFDVLLNDSDKDGDKLNITSVSTPGKGTAVISGGKIVYTPAANTCGGATDNFTYNISDGNGGTATATVAVTINNTTPPPPVNTAPVAVNDAYAMDCKAVGTFDVLLNDSDKDGDKLNITSVSTPGKGTAVISGGKIVYTPAANTCGGATDNFTYNISDGNGGTATATVAVTINNTTPPPPVNIAPVAVNDAYTVDCSVANTFNVLLNDSDKDGDKLTITSVSMPGKGTAVISNGNIIYTAAANTCGGAMDNFTYNISDGKGGTATATVAVTIRNTIPALPANNPPVAVNDLYIVPCRSNAVLDVLTNDSDRDGDPLTIISVKAITQPSVATLSISADKKTLKYTPGASCFVTESFSYTISDGKGGTATATVTLIDP